MDDGQNEDDVDEDADNQRTTSSKAKKQLTDGKRKRRQTLTVRKIPMMFKKLIIRFQLVYKMWFYKGKILHFNSKVSQEISTFKTLDK